jgi:hypothetical protein
MNDRTNRLASILRMMDADSSAPPPRDELDSLLREWHREHADVAAANREQILAAIASDVMRPLPRQRRSVRSVLATIGPVVMRTMGSRAVRAAACIILTAVFATIVLLPSRHGAEAAIINVAEGGELTAYSDEGDRLGPCPLQHTDVDAAVSGTVTRVTVRQKYANPYPQKIEANYTFPLSHRAAVDAMRIIVRGADGVERVVEGEVKERQQARRIYEDARRAGHVASLLEQERRNVFTQSVANIEPGATVTVEIGYVEFLERNDGEYRFAFPMVVAPRYIPGAPTLSPNQLPDGLARRAGVVLLAPAEVTVTSQNASLSGAIIQSMLVGATPVRTPSPEWMERPAANLGQPIDFIVTYANGTKEPGQLFEAGAVGQVNGRWYFTPVRLSGNGFAADTPQVTDASRITPMPNRPTERSGHDVSMSVTIDAGGMDVRNVRSDLHEIVESGAARPNHRTFTLKSKSTIPNRDFTLSWNASPTDVKETLGYGLLTHARGGDDESTGGYFAIMLEPPTRPKVDQVLPREIVFLIDTSGSMQGFPIEKSKEVMAKAIAAMRPADTFNVIAFAGSTRTLWPEPRTATDENRRLARDFVERQEGDGGTEMLPAFEAALKGQHDVSWLSPRALVDLPADGRAVRVEAPLANVDRDNGLVTLDDGKAFRVTFGVQIPSSGSLGADQAIQMTGRWMTEAGDRMLVVDTARFARSSVAPNRIVVFLTDGLVGNDGAILDLVRQYAKSTRVFAFGIGNSVNRNLLDGAARAGRGMAEFVTLPADADAAVARLTRRLESPVLVDISVDFHGVNVTELVPAPDRIPDLYDEAPLVLVGRFAKDNSGTVTVRGRNANGPWERTVPLALDERSTGNAAVASLWARAKVDAISEMNEQAIANNSVAPPLKREIVRLGERYGIMTPFTSFVAVEKSRVTVGGEPMLVQIPIELPEGMSWKGLFGEGVAPATWASRIAPDDPSITQRRYAAVTKLAQLAEPALEKSVDADSSARSLFFAETPIDLREAEKIRAAAANADKLLQGDDFRLAEREILKAGVQLESVRGALPESEYKNLRDKLVTMVEETAQKRALSEAKSVADPARADEASNRDSAINESLKRVRQLQMELKYTEAMQVLDEITFIDPQNPAALALKDVISASQQYRRYGDVEKRRWEAYAAESHKALEEMVPATPAAAGAGSAPGKRPVRGEDSGAFAPYLGDIPVLGGAMMEMAVPINSKLEGCGEDTNGGRNAPADGLSTTVQFPWQMGRSSLNDAGLLVYPEDWPEIAVLRSTSPGWGDTANINSLTRDQLLMPVDINLQHNSLGESLHYITTVTGAQFSVDWKALSKLSITPDDPVNLNLKNVTAEAAVDRMFLQLVDPATASSVPTLKIDSGVAVITAEPTNAPAPKGELKSVDKDGAAGVPFDSNGDANIPTNQAPGQSDAGAKQGRRRQSAPIAPPGQSLSGGIGSDTRNSTPPASDGATKAKEAPPKKLPDPMPTDPAPTRGVPTPGTPTPPPPAPTSGGPASGTGSAKPGASTPTDTSAARPAEPTSPPPPPESMPGAGGGRGFGGGAEASAPAAPSNDLSDRVEPLAAKADAPAVQSAGFAARKLSPEERDVLARRMQRDLLLVALAAQIDREVAGELAATARPEITLDANGRVRVTVLLRSGDAASLDADLSILRSRGVIIDVVDRNIRLVVARVDPRDLIAFGLADPVRRIESFRGSPDPRNPNSE